MHHCCPPSHSLNMALESFDRCGLGTLLQTLCGGWALTRAPQSSLINIAHSQLSNHLWNQNATDDSRGHGFFVCHFTCWKYYSICRLWCEAFAWSSPNIQIPVGSIADQWGDRTHHVRSPSVGCKLRRSSHSTISPLQTDEHQRLSFSKICDGVIDVADEVLERLNKVKAHGRKQGKVISSIQQAVKSCWQEQEVKALLKWLKEYKEAIETTVLFSLKSVFSLKLLKSINKEAYLQIIDLLTEQFSEAFS